MVAADYGLVCTVTKESAKIPKNNLTSQLIFGIIKA
jgi:hypothetical protein|nr:MAG TPA: Lantibiotic alpha [Caudoviricetes sp.]